MHLTIGQKVSYPNQGVCLVEELASRLIGESRLSGYRLRVLGDDSTIFVPAENVDSVGLRPVISPSQARQLRGDLSSDFEPSRCDWKTRSREFSQKLHSGDVFAAADVLKQLTFLSFEKKLSFREQTMLEKAKYLVVSELSNADRKDVGRMEAEVTGLVRSACLKHQRLDVAVMSASVH